MKRFVTGCVVAAMLWSWSGAALAVSVSHGESRFGLTMDVAPYQRNGLPLVRISDVDHRSDLYGPMMPGDYLFRIGTAHVQNAAHAANLIDSLPRGQVTRIYFLDASDGLRPKYYDALGIPPAPPPRVTAPAAGPTQKKDVAGTEESGFCDDNPLICVGLILGGLALVGGALSGPSGGGGSSGGSSSYDDYEPVRGTPSYTPPPPAPEPRTYGLYGNCPMPGAGYGC
jgi:hypothetical protein